MHENVTVQQYLEAEARKQAQCIQVHAFMGPVLDHTGVPFLTFVQHAQAKCEQQASELQEAWQKHKAELLDMKASL